MGFDDSELDLDDFGLGLAGSLATLTCLLRVLINWTLLVLALMRFLLVVPLPPILLILSYLGELELAVLDLPPSRCILDAFEGELGVMNGKG